MGKFYDKRLAELRDKHQMPDGKLQVEPGRNMPKLTEDKPAAKTHADYVLGLKKKFNVQRLEIEGETKAPDRTLADVVQDAEKEEMKGLTLSTASTIYQGKRTPIWFLKRK